LPLVALAYGVDVAERMSERRLPCQGVRYRETIDEDLRSGFRPLEVTLQVEEPRVVRLLALRETLHSADISPEWRVSRIEALEHTVVGPDGAVRPDVAVSRRRDDEHSEVTCSELSRHPRRRPDHGMCEPGQVNDVRPRGRLWRLGVLSRPARAAALHDGDDRAARVLKKVCDHLKTGVSVGFLEPIDVRRSDVD